MEKKILLNRSYSLITKLLILLGFISTQVLGQVSISTTNYTPMGCKPQKILFKAIASGATNYNWYFGDGNSANITTDTITHTFTNNGSFWVSVNASGNLGYLGSANIQIYVGVLYGGIGTSTDSACIGEPIGFNFYPYLNNYLWNFGDPGSGASNTSVESFPNHTYSQPGVHTVKLINNNQCGFDTVFKNIYVGNDAKPKAEFWFSSNTVCPGDEVSFSLANSNIQWLKWTFGEPSSGKADTSYDSYPVHFYSTLGKHVVKLTVQNSCGITSTRTDTVYVTNNGNFPQYLQIYVNYGSNEIKGCPGDAFRFYTNYNAKNMVWKFGDGDSSIISEPTHSFGSKGTYDVSVRIFNGCGKDTTIHLQAFIGLQKTFGNNAYIDAQPSLACPGDPISFNFSQAGISFNWNFGDGTNSNIANPVHSYATLGEKNISLNVTNSCGADSIFFTKVVVSDTLKPYLMNSKDGGNWGVLSPAGCPGDSILFYSFNGIQSNFDFGDGTKSNKTFKLLVEQGEVNVIKHAYNAVGKYKVKLTIFNSCGKSATDSLEINIGGALPIQGELGIINNEPYYTCSKIQFMATAGSDFVWYLPGGDSIISSESIFETTFNAPGLYTMKVKMVNGCGNSLISERQINIVELPKPLILETMGHLEVKTLADEYLWYLNGNPISGATKSTLMPQKSGMYKVRIKNTNGCYSTSDEIKICFVYAGEDVEICSGGSIQLNAFGTDSYSWSPSTDLNDANIANPLAQPLANTTYVVTGNSPGCTAHDTVKVTISGTLVAKAGNDVTICQGDSLILNGSGGGNYSWSPGATLKNADTQHPLAKPTVNTTYTLTVSSGGCTNSDDVIVTVQPKPTLIATGDAKICTGNTAQLQATYSNAAGIKWSGIGTFNPGTTGSPVTYTPSLGEKISGLATVNVMLTGTGACTALTDVLKIAVITVPKPEIKEESYYLKTTQTYAGYQWYKDGNLIDGATTADYLPSANGIYTVVCKGENDCMSDVSAGYNYVVTSQSVVLGGVFKIYPNPAKENLTIETNGQEVSAKIITIEGRVVYANKLVNSINQVPLQGLQPGTYLLKLQNSAGIKVVKFIKE